MHQRLPPDGQLFTIPRLYHSVGMLVPSGEVMLAGGQHYGPPGEPLLNSEHTLEVFRPPYTYQSGRPSLATAPALIHYAGAIDDGSGNQILDYQIFEVETAAPSTIERACLIGVGSVTHHFDYGQRYVELMTRPKAGATGIVEVFPPPKSSLAPPGYYLLFLVDAFEIPSSGRRVKLDYAPEPN
jgi:hypothetical protein